MDTGLLLLRTVFGCVTQEMSLTKCLHAVDAHDMAAVESSAPTDLTALIAAWKQDEMPAPALLYACKCFLLGHPFLDTERFLVDNGFNIAIVAKHPVLLNITSLLQQSYDDSTAMRAVNRAATMTGAQLRGYNSRKMVADLVSQCSNRDDRKNVKSKRSK